ncbi:MAG: hydrolase 1, exosortase A system-associated [Pseudomonadota bacterium]
MADERPLFFDTDGASLFGILHEGNGAAPRRGLVLVVGGPQYRVGSHRQFVLLARDVAAAGFPVLRFDYRGMGDSTGPCVDFEDIGDDIGAAVDTLCTQCPSVEAVTLWGLCDAASAAMFYAGRNADSRIDSLVLLNPWVRTEAGEARAQASGYYGSQLTSAAAWLSLLRNPGRVFRVIANLVGVARRSVAKEDAPEAALPERVMTSLDAFAGKALLLISGNDLTAREFLSAADADERCVRAIDTGRVSRCDLADADHTFSTAAWRDWVAQQTIAWLAR